MKTMSKGLIAPLRTMRSLGSSDIFSLFKRIKLAATVANVVKSAKKA